MFKKDLKFGQLYEKTARELISGGNEECCEVAPDKKFSDWDFRYNDISYEVKADRWICRSGNICIEFENHGAKSGIELTNADFWIIFAVGTEEKWKIPVDAINELLMDDENFTVKNVAESSKCYLFKKDIFSAFLF